MPTSIRPFRVAPRVNNGLRVGKRPTVRSVTKQPRALADAKVATVINGIPGVSRTYVRLTNGVIRHARVKFFDGKYTVNTDADAYVRSHARSKFINA